MIKDLQFSMYDLRFNLKNVCLVLVAPFLFSSCQHDDKKSDLEDASPYFTNFFTGNDEAVLRDISFNMNPDEVKKVEPSKLYETTADHLFFEFSYPTDSTAFSEYANVQYFFNENNQLDIITADIYLNDSIQEQKLRNTLTQYYNKRYGNPDADDNNVSVWSDSYKDLKTNTKLNYSIAIKDLEDDDFGVSIEYLKQ